MNNTTIEMIAVEALAALDQYRQIRNLFVALSTIRCGQSLRAVISIRH